jgi:cell division protein FtsI/penicillin-binding protein 2
MLDKKSFKKQADIIILCLAAWAVVCIAVFFYYAVIARTEYIRLGNRIASRELLYYPERSKILDKNGVVLAWSEKYYDLYYNNLTGTPKRVEIIYEKVKKIFPHVQKPSVNDVHAIMLRALQPRQILALEKAIYLFQELQIEPRIERKVVDYPEIRTYVGNVKFEKGRLIGVSGLEKTYNEVLSGSPGRYRIMLDRNKNWIKNSGKSIKLAISGKDIKLNLSLEEILKRRKP